MADPLNSYDLGPFRKWAHYHVFTNDTKTPFLVSALLIEANVARSPDPPLHVQEARENRYRAQLYDQGLTEFSKESIKAAMVSYKSLEPGLHGPLALHGARLANTRVQRSGEVPEDAKVASATLLQIREAWHTAQQIVGRAFLRSTCNPRIVTALEDPALDTLEKALKRLCSLCEQDSVDAKRVTLRSLRAQVLTIKDINDACDFVRAVQVDLYALTDAEHDELKESFKTQLISTYQPKPTFSNIEEEVRALPTASQTIHGIYNHFLTRTQAYVARQVRSNASGTSTPITGDAAMQPLSGFVLGADLWNLKDHDGAELNLSDDNAPSLLGRSPSPPPKPRSTSSKS
mmetsp:Transcript_41580/g.81244  ORF Transcript_41580/g.81244 Transcript_41580/m.81244 type:complete len:346 (+) Transcript_41580:351-1388(+)